MKILLLLASMWSTALLSAEFADQPSVTAMFINEDAAPATIIIRTATHEARHVTGRKGSSIGPFILPLNAMISIQGKGLDERTIPATMFLSNPCCIISSVQEPGGQGKLALVLQFGPHKACSAGLQTAS